MRAVMLTGLRQMVLREVPAPPAPGPADVLLQLETVGVCGSDIHYYTTGRIGSQVVQYPFVVGHECAARIAAVGADVKDLRVGDRVALDPAVSCGACDQCQRGRPHTCRRLQFLGCPGQLAGCLQDQIVMPAACCFRVAPDLSPELTALVEPLSIGWYAVKLAAMAPGAHVAVLGAGPIGLSVLLAARDAGAASVVVSEPLAYRRAAALAAGANAAVAPDELLRPGTADSKTGVGGGHRTPIELVFECCGQPAALDQAVELLEPGGKLMLVGIPEGPRVSFSIDLLRRKELCLQNVRRQNGAVAPAIALVERHRAVCERLVTHRFALADCQAAFDLVAAYRDGVVKAMIEF